MGALRCALSVCPATCFLFDIIPQILYPAAVDTEEAFTTFVNACAQAGAAKCLPVSMIQGNATGPDVRLLFTSTIDVSLHIPMCVSCKIELGPIARPEVAEGRIYWIPITKWRTQA